MNGGRRSGVGGITRAHPLGRDAALIGEVVERKRRSLSQTLWREATLDLPRRTITSYMPNGLLAAYCRPDKTHLRRHPALTLHERLMALCAIRAYGCVTSEFAVSHPAITTFTYNSFTVFRTVLRYFLEKQHVVCTHEAILDEARLVRYHSYLIATAARFGVAPVGRFSQLVSVRARHLAPARAIAGAVATLYYATRENGRPVE